MKHTPEAIKHTLEADGIKLDFGLKPILSDIYIKCETGTITGLLGRNGQGKTCLMRVLYGDLEASSRSVRFDKESVPQACKRPELLLYMPQFNFIPGSLAVQRVFDDFGLEFRDFAKSFPELTKARRTRIRHLSGGQRRLVEIYTIVKSKASFVLLDEPFSHLMPLQIEKIREMLQEEKENKGILITDHLYRDVACISDFIYVLVNGKTHQAKNEEEIERLGYVHSSPRSITRTEYGSNH
jgi:ABC-type multidrug transport system ATPase subunit